MKKLIVLAMLISAVAGAANDLSAQAMRGNNALEAGDYAKAIEALEAATRKKHSGWCHNSFLLAYAYYQNKQPAEALTIFDEIFRGAEKISCYDNGFVPAWHYWRGRAAYDLGRYADAASSFAAAAETAPVALPADFWPQWKLRTLQPIKEYCYNWLGGSQFRAGDLPAAAVSYNKAIELNAKERWNYISLARTYVALKRLDEALPLAKKAFEIQADATGHMILGEVYVARRQYGEAEAAFKKAVELEPKRTDLYEMLGRVYFDTENYEAGLEVFRKEAELVPSNPYPLYLIGLMKKRMGLFDEARAALDKAIGLITFVGVGLSLQSDTGETVLARAGDDETGLLDGPAKEAGLRAGDVILKIDGRPVKGLPRDKVAESLRGEAGTQVVVTVRRQGVAQPFEKTITRRLIVPKEAGPYFGQRSGVFWALRDPDGALKDAEQALALDPNDISARETLAVLDLDAGRLDAAISGLAAMKDSPYARILEATAYAKKGDLDKAAVIYAGLSEDDLSARSAFRQLAKAALLRELQPFAQQVLDKARAAESAGRGADALQGYAKAILVSDEATASLIRQRAAILLKTDPAASALPEEARKFALRGDVLIKEGSFAEALAEYRSALRIAPLIPQLHYNTALIHGQLKSYRAAIRSMTVYLQLAPDAPNARAAKDEIYKWEFMLEKEGKK